MIINSHLTAEQENDLLEVIRINKKAIGWTLSDLVGISPTFVCITSEWKKGQRLVETGSVS